MKNATFSRVSSQVVMLTLQSREKEANKTLFDLHSIAHKLKAERVSPIFSLKGRECKPRPIGFHDPLRDLKVDAIMKTLYGLKAILVEPTNIKAFTITLSDGQKINLGLCEYPSKVNLDDGSTFEVSDTDCLYWQSSVKDISWDSYVVLRNFLNCAKNIGICIRFDDRTNFSNDPIPFEDCSKIRLKKTVAC